MAAERLNPGNRKHECRYGGQPGRGSGAAPLAELGSHTENEDDESNNGRLTGQPEMTPPRAREQIEPRVGERASCARRCPPASVGKDGDAHRGSEARAAGRDGEKSAPHLPNPERRCVVCRYAPGPAEHRTG